MSTVIYWLSHLTSLLVDAVTWPVRSLSPIWGLSLVSLISGVILLWIYGKVSNQNRIREVKRKIHAALLEAVLYRHDLKVSLKAQGRMLGLGAWYFLIAIPPLLILIVPCLFLLAQLNIRYGYEPLGLGKAAIVRVKVEDPAQLYRVELKAPQGLAVTPALRIRDKKEIVWRIEPNLNADAEAPSALHAITLTLGDSGQDYQREIAVQGASSKNVNSPIQPMSSQQWWMQLLYPDFSIRSLADQIAEVSIDYPDKEVSLFGLSMHWIIVFLVLSLVSGLVAARVLHIAI